jgi:choline-glycine betaine transporter
MPRTPYLTIIVSAIILGIASEVLIISNHGANPFADLSRLIVGSIMWVILIMIALLLFFFMYTRMSNR